MKDNEILERIYFADVLMGRASVMYFEKYKKQPTTKELNKRLIEVNEKAEKLSIQEIRKEIKKNPVDYKFWLPRYAGGYCKILKINPNELCLDDSHAGTNSKGGLDNLGEQRGVKLKDIFLKHKDNSEIQRRNSFVSKNFDLLMSKGKIIVRNYKDSFEVMLGNHRVMVACSKGLKEIEVLCICNEEDSKKCIDFKFQ